MYSPLLNLTSCLTLSIICINPSDVKIPISPVTSHPSTKASFVLSGSSKYPLNKFGPLNNNSPDGVGPLGS